MREAFGHGFLMCLHRVRRRNGAGCFARLRVVRVPEPQLESASELRTQGPSDLEPGLDAAFASPDSNAILSRSAPGGTRRFRTFRSLIRTSTACCFGSTVEYVQHECEVGATKSRLAARSTVGRWAGWPDTRAWPLWGRSSRPKGRATRRMRKDALRPRSRCCDALTTPNAGFARRRWPGVAPSRSGHTRRFRGCARWGQRCRRRRSHGG